MGCWVVLCNNTSDTLPVDPQRIDSFGNRRIGLGTLRLVFDIDNFRTVLKSIVSVISRLLLDLRGFGKELAAGLVDLVRDFFRDGRDVAEPTCLSRRFVD